MPHLLTNLKLTGLFLILPLLSQKISAQGLSGKASFGKKGFIENKGQIINQDNKANNEVLYLLNMSGLNVQLKRNSFSYDTYVLKAVPKEKITQGDDSLDYLADFHRIDIEFIGANPNPVVVSSEASADYLNFYTPGTPTGGVHGVKHYRKVLYKELYPSIDLEFVFSPEGNKPFEYNFILHPGADIKQVEWKYVGSDKTTLENGKIEIETIHGILRESIPFSYIQETGETVTLTYRNTGTNSFGLTGPTSDIPGTIVVDPVPELLWAGYLGFSWAHKLSSDYTGNILFTISGTANNIATRGVSIISYPILYESSGLVKINTQDQIVWTTFVAFANLVVGSKDPSGAIYLAGNTNIALDIATPGTHQANISGQDEAFLIKLDSSGNKIWGTFFGGPQRDFVNTITVDGNQNIYMGGYTTSDIGISTPGAHQTNRNGYNDGFLSKFDSSGILVLSTYYGGASDDYVNGIAVNDSGNIFFVGETNSTNLIATPGSYRTTSLAREGFVVKFNSAGQRIWSTFLGGNNIDRAANIIASDSGHIFVLGGSRSDSIFGTQRPTNLTSFISRFDYNGNYYWSDFFDGPFIQIPYYAPSAFNIDSRGDLYVASQVFSNGLASPNAPFTTLNGSSDTYIIKYSSAGQRVFTTYFGGNNNDDPKGIFLREHYLYLFGDSESSEELAFNSPFEQTAINYGKNVFLAKFLNASYLENNASVKQDKTDNYLCGSGNIAGLLTLFNSGQNPIDSVRINWELDGVIQPTIFYVGTLQMGADTSIFLDSILLQPGNKRSIRAWASMPNGMPDSYANDDTVLFELMPGLSGTYTVNKQSGDYTSLNATSDDLHKFGVCGPVRFEISNDVYAENLLFKSIKGASMQNFISYIGTHKDSAIIEYDMNGFSDFAAIRLDGAKHFNFSNLTLRSLDSATAIGLWLRNYADSNNFVNLQIELPYESAPNSGIAINIAGLPFFSKSVTRIYGNSSGSGGSYNSFDSIYFIGGSCQVRLQHTNDTLHYAEGNSFAHLIVPADKIKTAIFQAGQQRDLSIENSLFENTHFYFGYSDGLKIASNIFINSTLLLANINYLKRDTLKDSRLINNFFKNAAKFPFTSVVATVENSSDIFFHHNTFFNDTFLYCMRGMNSIIQITNNIFYTYKYAHSFPQGTITADYNIYHRTDPILGNFTSVPTNEPNSLILDPLFVTDSTVEVSRYVPGMPVGLESDIFGRPRCLTAPAIGAYEPTNWIFTQPQISQNRTAFVNYPIIFSHNADTLPGTEFQWLLDGSFVADSITLFHTFSDNGGYSIQLVVKNCVKTDTVTYTVNVLPANPLLSLLGKNPDSLTVFNTYLDSGAVAVDIWGQDISHLIQTSSNLDTAVLGNYTITYLAIDSVGNRDSVSRTITVFDSIAPQLYLIGNDTLFIDVFASINDPGATATDNYDKAVVVIADSSAVNKSKTGFWQIVYTATDSSGNNTQITRWIKVQDTIKPTAQLLGPDTLIMEVHTSFNDPGINITDNYCQTAMSWTRTSDPDTALLGDYLIEYTATDCEGNTGLPIYRTVQVRDQTAPLITLIGNSTVQHDRWTTYQDAGATLSDNYYSPVILQDSLKTHTDLDESAEGTYTFCYDLTDPSGNQATTICRTIQVKENPNTITSPNKLNPKLYPNPNKGEFVLELYQAAGDNTYITLSDMAGREIYRRQLNSGGLAHNIQLEGVSSGSYILNLVSTDGKVSYRVEVLR